MLGGSRREFVDCFRGACSKCWEVKCESFGSKVSVLEFELDLSKCSNGMARLSISPYTKPTYRPLSLSNSSSHPPHMHRWPMAQFYRLYRNSSSYFIFDSARRNLFKQYEIHGMRSGIILECLALDPSSSFQGYRTRDDVKWFSLVLSFHPLFDNLRLNRVLEVVLGCYEYELSNLFGTKIGFRLAWRNDSCHLQHKLRSISRWNLQLPPKGGW